MSILDFLRGGRSSSGTTGGRGYQRSANPGPAGAGDIPDPELYGQSPYLVPTGPGTGLPDTFYTDPDQAMSVGLMGTAHNRAPVGPESGVSVEDAFAEYLSSGMPIKEALRAAFIDAVRATAENDVAFDSATPMAAERRKRDLRYGNEGE
jgi:hypothetical protein